MSPISSWIPKAVLGPTVALCGLGVAYQNGFTFPYVSSLTLLYMFGMLPKVYFPPIMTVLYNLYCSKLVGLRIKHVMHPRNPYAHSDYTAGVRHLSAPGAFALAPAAAAAESAGGVARAASVTSGVFIVPVPMMSDNYSYLICSGDTGKCAVVDPSDPFRVLSVLREVQETTRIHFEITEILTTHKHWDHSGGNVELLELAQMDAAPTKELLSPSLVAYGSLVDRPHGCTRFLKDDDVIKVAGGGATVKALSAPGHTRGSLVFLTADSHATGAAGEQVAIFTGDSIFCAGFGAPFETPFAEPIITTYELFHSDRVLVNPVSNKQTPENHVLLYVGHEYTEMLLDELKQITTTLVAKPSADDSTRAFHQEVERERVNVARVRNIHFNAKPLVAADAPATVGKKTPEAGGLTTRDASTSTHAPAGAQPPNVSLPQTTMPTTLAIQKRVNPLLTTRKEDMDELAELTESSFSVDKMQNVLYTSLKRRLA